MLKFFVSFICTATFVTVTAQPKQPPYTRADTLRGSITAGRAWWNVLKYDITVQPDYANKHLLGKSSITYKVLQDKHANTLQLDLQEPLAIDSIVLNNKSKLNFTKEGNAWHVQPPQQAKGSVQVIDVYYQGQVHEAKRAPWDGGWTFTTDSLSRPWMTVTCQGLGASIWYPCKDHQSDEPDNGASLTMIVPDTLVAVANGRLQSKTSNGKGTATYTWAVVSPINNYDIIPYIGKYVNFKDLYNGEKGQLDIDYWVLDYNLDKAKDYLPKEVNSMLQAFEHWFGPYPFYEDGYKLIDVPHTGMEHQSAVAYGNWYKPGYRGRDGSGTGWGLKWDFIVIHESGHEWFGNNITSNDLADMWIHEGFTNYSETLYIDYLWGSHAANAYNAGIRRGIRNDKPIIPDYNINAQGSGDMYPKASNMIHAIRHSINNDTLFRSIMRGLNKAFYHKTVDAAEIKTFFSKSTGFNCNKVFDQYLTTTQIPVLEYYTSSSKVFYRYSNCIKGFNLPLLLKDKTSSIKIFPGEAWKSSNITAAQSALFNKAAIESMYYITAEQKAAN
ncbi:M1 family metallopeptidase [Foetidibacter luteolus]|uniref:M1 family metallopeptidase n=1 Tax=Foetidibacter luteolus TaxID=2608880 RepID=UPI00129BDC5F|nr:M1 family metallopeptidase [Foetidibacter luteolus]